MFDKEFWLNTKKANLFVNEEKQFFHNHANEILSFKTNYKKKFIDALSEEINITPRVKTESKNPCRGIKANDLNKEIRILLRNSMSELREEVNQENGVYYYSNKEKKQVAGFDFAILNSMRNLHKLHDLCFGKLRYEDGNRRWSKFLKNNPDLLKYANSIDLKKEKKNDDIPLILGEIQFGNWALAYRDFFKVLKANVQTSVDCLIYICPTGQLESMLSDGIVTFDKTKKIIKEFEKVISIPIWLIGIDLNVKK